MPAVSEVWSCLHYPVPGGGFSPPGLVHFSVCAELIVNPVAARKIRAVISHAETFPPSTAMPSSLSPRAWAPLHSAWKQIPPPAQTESKDVPHPFILPFFHFCSLCPTHTCRTTGSRSTQLPLPSLSMSFEGLRCSTQLNPCDLSSIPCARERVPRMRCSNELQPRHPVICIIFATNKIPLTQISLSADSRLLCALAWLPYPVTPLIIQNPSYLSSKLMLGKQNVEFRFLSQQCTGRF